MNQPASPVAEPDPSSGGETCRLLRPDDRDSLADLFERLKRDPETRRFFHPHPLDGEEARRITRYSGLDVYVGCFEGTRCVGYAMLRGWEAGYATPSFGVAVDPERRSEGLGPRLRDYCVNLAHERGAPGVMLHVHPANHRAIRIYEAVGFRQEGRARDEQIVMRLTFDVPMDT